MPRARATWMTALLTGIATAIGAVVIAMVTNIVLVAVDVIHAERDGKLVTPTGGRLALTLTIMLVTMTACSLVLARWLIRRRDRIVLSTVPLVIAGLVITTVATFQPAVLLAWVIALRYVPAEPLEPDVALDVDPELVTA